MAVIGLRLGERRTLAQLGAFDFAVAVGIGAIIGRTVTTSSASFATGAVALVTLQVVHRLVAFARRHSRIARIIDHPPRVLVTQGKIQDRELARAGLTATDLYALLRQQGVDDLSQVGYLLYETRGVTTVIGADREPGPLMRDGLFAPDTAMWPSLLNGMPGSSINKCCLMTASMIPVANTQTVPRPGDLADPIPIRSLPMSLLQPGDTFPELTFTVPGGKTVTVPETFAGQFGVVLFYRGAWCPYCNAQLRGFQRASATLADAGVQVAALSVDDEAATAGLIAKHGLTFPVGYGADARAIADLTGAFVNPEPVYLQSTGFVLDPGGKVVVSVYSSGAIGRLVPEDVAGLVRYVRGHAATSA